MGNVYTEAQKRATRKYLASVAKITIRTTNDKKELIRAKAEAEGKSVNLWILDLIDKALETEDKTCY